MGFGRSSDWQYLRQQVQWIRLHILSTVDCGLWTDSRDYVDMSIRNPVDLDINFRSRTGLGYLEFHLVQVVTYNQRQTM
jgi:hypothetical protein